MSNLGTYFRGDKDRGCHGMGAATDQEVALARGFARLPEVWILDPAGPAFGGAARDALADIDSRIDALSNFITVDCGGMAPLVIGFETSGSEMLMLPISIHTYGRPAPGKRLMRVQPAPDFMR